MAATKIYIVKIGFQDLMDYWTQTHKAFFHKEDANEELIEVFNRHKNPPVCPNFEGEDEYYDRTRLGLTSPDEDEAMKVWEKAIEEIEYFDRVYIEELEVY